MPKVTKPLTNTEIAKAKPKEKEYSLADGDGLSLRIKPNGSKLWIFNYQRPYTKQRANIGFGVFPEVSLVNARGKRLEARAQLAKDIDPKKAKDQLQMDKKAESENTIESVARAWFEVKRKSITPNYAEDIIRSLENHVFPRLGKFPVTEVSAPEVIKVLRPLAVVGKLEMVKRLCSRLNQMMVYATNTGIVHANPLQGIRDAFEVPKAINNPTIRPEELPELILAIQDANIRRVTRHLIFWQLHTMTRPSEAAGARWEEIDYEQGLWVIPLERMKKRREHVVPLSAQALSILERIKPVTGGGEYIFPGDVSPTKPANSSTVNVALRRMGYQGRLTAHGLRSIASTALNEQGFDPDLIESSLAHVDKNQTRSAYNRAQYIERRRGMMEWWSDYVEGM